MTRILLPTDLSDQALLACTYVVRLFGTGEMSYTLVHAYMDAGVGTDPWPDADGSLYQATVEALEEWSHRLQDMPGLAGIPFTCEVVYGPLAAVVNALAVERGADLVAMGTRGAAGAPIFGSNAGELVKHAKVPVLVVPVRSEGKPVKRILFADDERDVDANALRMLPELARRTGADVVLAHVLRTEDEVPDEEVVAEYDALLGDIPHRFVAEEGKDVATVIDLVAEREGADLIAVLHRRAGFLESIFHPSTAKRLALHSRFPLLVMHQRERER